MSKKGNGGKGGGNGGGRGGSKVTAEATNGFEEAAFDKAYLERVLAITYEERQKTLACLTEAQSKLELTAIEKYHKELVTLEENIIQMRYCLKKAQEVINAAEIEKDEIISFTNGDEISYTPERYSAEAFAVFKKISEMKEFRKAQPYVY